MSFAVFVMTDVVGSTSLWETHRDDMQAALEQHDRLLRESVATGGGRIFKHTGDGMLATFGTTDAAVAAALDIIDGLAAASWGPTGPLEVRVSVHAGQVAERDGDYFGPPLNKTARINGIGHAGQVLVSDVARQLMQPPRGIDLGEHQLRDLSEPVRLWQLDNGDHPPLRTLVRARHNLPVMPTQFIGRDAEITELRRLVAGHRLVTLTGVGGCGKTRLAVEVGAASADRFPGGIWFVDLSPEQDGAAVGTRALAALGLVQPLTDHVGPASALADATNGMPTLLIVDNCEHLIDDVADFADAVVAECPSVTVLATSRESLAIDGEHVWRIPNLSDGAVELFIERASAAGADATELAEQVELINRICRSLDDIPLAIELAAAHSGSLPLQALADRLDDRFAILGGGRRRGRNRQRQHTLQTMMDWSYGLLSDDEKTLLDELAVFSGTFSVTGAEAVASPAQTPVRERLQALVEQSLVTPPTSTGRYRLLETVRLYALGRLAEAGTLRQTRDRHLAWMTATIGADAYFDAGRHDGKGQNVTRERLCLEEIENGIAAMEWADENQRDDDVFSLLIGLDPVWSAVSPYARTGLEWLRRVPAPPESRPTDRATWMAVAGQIHMNLGDIATAFEYFLEGADLADLLRQGDPARFAFWMSNLMFRSIMHATTGNYERAFADADLIAELAEEAGSHREWLRSGSLMARAMIYAHLGDPRRLAAAQRALAAIEGYSTWGEINGHALVADAMADQGRFEHALDHAQVCLDAAMVNESMRALAIIAAARAFAALGRFDDALGVVELDTGPMLEGQRRHMANALLTALGAILVELGDRDRAERILAVAANVTDDAFDTMRRRRIGSILGDEEAVDQLPTPHETTLELSHVARVIDESIAHARTLMASTAT